MNNPSPNRTSTANEPTFNTKTAPKSRKTSPHCNISIYVYLHMCTHCYGSSFVPPSLFNWLLYAPPLTRFVFASAVLASACSIHLHPGTSAHHTHLLAHVSPARSCWMGHHWPLQGAASSSSMYSASSPLIQLMWSCTSVVRSALRDWANMQFH